MTDASPHPARAAPPSRLHLRHLTGLRAHRITELIALRLAPAFTGGAITYSHTDSEWQGTVVLLGMLAAALVLRGARYPLHLVPLAAAALYLAIPPLGAALAILVCAWDGYAGSDLSAGDMVAPVLGAWLVTALGAFVTHRVRHERQVRVAVIGSPEFASSLKAELEAVGVRGYQVVGYIDPRRATSRTRTEIPFLGSLVILRQIVLDGRLELLVLGPSSPASADTVDSEFKTVGPSRLELFEAVAEACLDLPVSMIEAGQLYEELFGHVPLGTTTSAWFQYLLHPSYRGSWATSKRLLDIGVGLIAAVIAAPIVLASAIAIKLSDGGPVLYRQTRLGERGREIELLKLRTMRPDADAGPRGAEGNGEVTDQVTAVGKVLRRLHINEVPQIWQILKGEMSIVGPRPEIPEVVYALESRFTYYDRRHLLKPGITGWASVRCGYSGTPIGEAWKLCHDLYYLKHRSLFFDLLIMLETVSAIFIPEPIKRPDERFIVAAASAEGYRLAPR